MQLLTMLMLGCLIGGALALALLKGRARSDVYSIERQPLTAHTTLLVLRSKEREIMILESARTITRIVDLPEMPVRTDGRVAPHEASPSAQVAQPAS